MDEPKEIKPEKLVKDLKILTAISLGKDRNKELAKVLDTDKSFTSKKVKELEEKGLISKVGDGKETRYRINPFHVMQFLQSTVVITTKKRRSKDERKNEKRSKSEV
jgi:DNA-binding HxlR family transcriptional regulator